MKMRYVRYQYDLLYNMGRAFDAHDMDWSLSKVALEIMFIIPKDYCT